MHIFKFPFSMLPLLLLSIFIGRAQADQACQLLVFNQYCLGGGYRAVGQSEAGVYPPAA